VSSIKELSLSSTLALSSDRKTVYSGGWRHFLIISMSRFTPDTDKYSVYWPPSSGNSDWSQPNGQSRAEGRWALEEVGGPAGGAAPSNFS